MRVQTRLVRLGFVFLWKNTVCGKIHDFEFLLVDLGGFVAGYGRPLVKELGTCRIRSLGCLRGHGGGCFREQG
jgi:hypothetical protein